MIILCNKGRTVLKTENFKEFRVQSRGVGDSGWRIVAKVIDFTFDRYIAALEQYVAPTTDKGVNYFTFGSGKDANNTLNLDAIYIYKE